MASRPKGFGLTSASQNKKKLKYDPEKEQQVKRWIRDVLQMNDIPSDNFQKTFQDGQLLCQVANTFGGKIKINSSKMALKQKENIGNFLTFAYSKGINESEMFETVDLYEGENIPAVINGIFIFASKLEQLGYSVPQIGPKESSASKKSTTEEQKEGQGIIGLQGRSIKRASQSGSEFGIERQRVI